MVPCSLSATLLALMLLIAGKDMPPSDPSATMPKACSRLTAAAQAHRHTMDKTSADTPELGAV
jgi:hypothetical protein